MKSAKIFIPQSFSKAIEDGFIRLLKFDEKENKWTPNYIWTCGTMTKKERKEISRNLASYKFNSNAERRIELNESDWFFLVKSYVDSGFTELQSYNGTGKYKFQIPFTQNSETFISESPEFEVIEKDFKK